METKDLPSAETLGQIALIQSMVIHLPDKENILSFVCQGLLEVPGVARAEYRLDEAGDDDRRPADENQALLRNFTIKSGRHAHGELLLYLSAAEAFLPYAPFIENLGNMLAVIFEERRQRSLNRAILADLERRVNERTQELALEVNERKQAEKALQVEKERVERYLDIIEVILVVLDDRARIRLINRKGYQVLGYDPGELDGKNWFELCLPPEDYEAMAAIYQQTIAGTITPFEYYENNILTRRGEKRYVAWHNSILTDDDGRVIGTLSSGEDITERRQAEEALRESEENLRITLNSIGDGVISTDINGNISRMNRVAETLTGWQQNEALGKPLTEVFKIVNEETRKPVASPVKKVLEANEVVGLANHTVLLARDGAEYQIADSGAPIRDAAGKVTGVVLVFRDVTEQQKTEQELLKVKKLESVGILAGGIAHDFNNLLTGLFGNLEMAKMLLSTDHKAYAYLESAGRSMDTAINLTKQLLTFARGGDPIKDTLAIGRVISETARFSVRGSKARLQINLAPDLWLVEADKGQLSQVISNLVINAEQAMPTGGAITLAAKNVATSAGRYVQITVQDEGVGIAPQYLEKIFDPYFTTKHQGSGLGLAITHSIISKHNGRLTVDSHLNQGTIFTITLPATDKPAAETIEGPSPEAHTSVVTSARILVMDDEESVRAVLAAMLKRMGYEASFAADGQTAIEKYQTAFEKGRPYDVVITDLTIPGGMGGQAAAREILKIDPQAKLIVSSGYATDPVLANCEEYGFKGVVVKPFRLAELQQVIRRVLEM